MKKKETRHLMVATKMLQGQRKNDFCWTKEGEFVHIPLECDGEEIDGQCGCRRAMSGLHTAQSTTTVRVVEVTKPEALKVYNQLLNHYMKGWKMPKLKAQDIAVAELKELIKSANLYPVNAVLERRGEVFQYRGMAVKVVKP